MAARNERREWAEDDEFDDPNALPANEIRNNPDGTKTTITYRLENGKKIKTTRRIRVLVVKERVNPRVAERREWSKFGSEKGKGVGPDLATTTVGENIIFKPSNTWKATEKEDQTSGIGALKSQMKDKKVSCRICQGEHFTARCPFKDTLAPVGEAPPDDGGADMPDVGGAQSGPGGSYVPPHLRKGGKDMGGGSSPFGKQERDDLATLRVTNLSEFAEENDLRDMFERFGRVTRVFLAKDRDTGRAKGFAFVSYQDRMDAQRACEKMDGFGYGHLILKVEFAKRSQ